MFLEYFIVDFILICENECTRMRKTKLKLDLQYEDEINIIKFVYLYVMLH